MDFEIKYPTIDDIDIIEMYKEKLKLIYEEIKEQLSTNLFENNKFVNNCSNGSPYQVINATYPNKFKPEDFKYFYRYSKETKSTLQKSSKF